jgi:hypothetical protein
MNEKVNEYDESKMRWGEKKVSPSTAALWLELLLCIWRYDFEVSSKYFISYLRFL